MAGGCHPADSQRSRNSVHIALIAMSGVRAWSKEITEAGLTMPGFLERSEAIASLPSLALLTLAGMTPDPFEVSYHEVLDIHRLGELPDCDVPRSPPIRPRSRMPTPSPPGSGRSACASCSAACT